MEHALALARKGIGLASPNPHVGCVIVRDGEIVGEGFHQYDWRDHAEIVALKSAGEKARGATLYVNLEPCNHTGRTSPCTEAIIAAGVHRVVAPMQDPNPANSGRGFERLRAAKIETVCGVLEDDARRLNEAFACWIRTRKSFVTLKSALTLDGQLALPKAQRRKKRTWITSEDSRGEVQRMRHASDALLTELGKREILSVLLESGPTLNGAALSAGVVHKLMLFYAPKFGGETGVPFARMLAPAQTPLPSIRVQQFGPDVAIEAYLEDVYRNR